MVTATRPRNRRQLIVEAAGQVFSERGYHAASMEEIAAAEGISAAALYRHFPNKQALFAECANVFADRLVEALPDAGDLTEVLTALTRVTVARRASAGLYRWEARHLEEAARQRLRVKFGHVVGRVVETSGGERLRAIAALGAIGSITMHRTSIAQHRIEELLVASAAGVVATDPAVAAGTAGRVELPAQPVPRTRRAEILAAAVPLFARDGFANVTNGQIAQVVGLAPSAIYRHYPSKVEILVAACLRAAGLLSQAVDRSLHRASDPRAAVLALAAAYVAYSFEHNALTSVAEAELRGLPADRRRPLIVAQRAHIGVWEQRLRAVRPELDPRSARLLVHAGFGVVVEAGRALRWRDTPGHRDAVTALVTGAMI
ncbi:TetR/AcrR family transcriptional regulator [Paractinoplanes ferrugineus]|uniref:TetR family transcriptional regulator n=1 Tax=Paractinoplanes ferrugineus TaxID=113564 RepID=A0A919IWV4_9ACTN|nr:TetR/AcrR family transcriptional regulator [Actinoplanes ferrugineus]GIE10541.1 TetR family transcriptional regulator [Actinoplanes ferrugineus]